VTAFDALHIVSGDSVARTALTIVVRLEANEAVLAAPPLESGRAS